MYYISTIATPTQFKMPFYAHIQARQKMPPYYKTTKDIHISSYKAVSTKYYYEAPG